MTKAAKTDFMNEDLPLHIQGMAARIVLRAAMLEDVLNEMQV
jgi:hypothetical protein